MQIVDNALLLWTDISIYLIHKKHDNNKLYTALFKTNLQHALHGWPKIRPFQNCNEANKTIKNKTKIE